MTDEYSAYRWLKKGWTGEHATVCHHTKEYARGDVRVNTAESSHALIRRGLIGIYHNVSREYLHRYLWQFDFLWNNRNSMMASARLQRYSPPKGKRLMHKDPLAERKYIKNREQKEGGEQLGSGLLSYLNRLATVAYSLGCIVALWEAYEQRRAERAA